MYGIAKILPISEAKKYSLIWQSLIYFLIVGLVFTSSIANAEPVKIATSKTGWVIWIAEERGLFASNDVEVSIELVSSGVAASKGVLDGQFDLGTTSEFAFVSQSLKSDTLRIVSTVAAIDNVFVIARGDSGIKTAADLKGHKIGVLKSAIGEFFLGQLLILNGMQANDVETFNVRPPEMPKWIAEGKGSAIVSWEPYANQSRNVLGDNHVSITAQGGQPYYFVLMAQNTRLEKLGDKVEKIVRALHQAASWAYENQDQAKQILSEKLQIDIGLIKKNWPNHVMGTFLPQNVLFLMEEEARWRISRGISPDNPIPNFVERLYMEPLTRVAPSNVTIIR